MVDKLKNMKSSVAIIISIVTFITTGYLYIDGKYALASDVIEVKKEVKVVKLKMTYQKALDNLYSYRSLSRKYPNDVKLQEELKKAKEEVAFIKTQLEKI